MTYVSWAVLYEGDTDANYMDVLIPRLIEEIIRAHPGGNSDIPTAPALRLHRGSVDVVAREACDARDAFYLAFIHADTGGRNLEESLATRAESYCEAMHELCNWPTARCITISPRHETEAWVLADPQAVTSVLGYTGTPASIGLPENAAQAERLVDPKAVLLTAVDQVRGRRRRFAARQIFPAIAQRQSFAALRQARSFIAFEANLLAALTDLGCIEL